MTLAPTESKLFTDLCYTATSADETGDPVSPNDIHFSDQLTEVKVKGLTTGKEITLTETQLPSAECKLCGDQPPCPFGQDSARSTSPKQTTLVLVARKQPGN